MINETINNTLGTVGKIDFSTWTNVTTNNLFILSALIVWLLPLILMLIVGAVVRGGSQGSRKCMLEFPNFWIWFFIYFFIQSALFLGIIIFPLWLRMGWFGG